jgi:predicted RNA-binding Zn ribbon-like protein
MSMTGLEFREEGFGQSAWIDLVNSEHWDGFDQLADHLADPSWVSLYFRHWHFSHRSGSVHFDELRKLRVFLRTLAERWATRRVLTAGDIVVINEALSVPVRRIFNRDAQAYAVRLEPLRSGKKWLRAQIVESLARSFTGHGAERIKMCPNRGCRWVFYDRTHGNTRKWCSARLCGNREWVRRARQIPKRVTL